MKRALTILLAVLIATPALGGRAVVIAPSGKELRSATLGNMVLVAGAMQATLDQTTGTLTRLNTYGRSGFDVVRPSAARTTLARYGSVGGKSYSVVIWPAWRLNVSSVAGGFPPGLTPESLTVSAAEGNGNYTPTVRHVFVDGYPNECGFATNAAYDSTGWNGETFDPAHQGPGYAGGRTGINGTDYWWQTPQGAAAGVGVWRNAGGGSPTDTTADPWVSASGEPMPDGGWRTVVGQQASNWVNSPFEDTPPAWRDSLYQPLDAAHAMVNGWGAYQWSFPDGYYGMYVADQLNGHIDGAAPITYIHWAGFSPPDVGGAATYTDNRNIGDPIIVPIGLAHVDSVTGGDLFGPHPNVLQLSAIMRGVAFHKSGMYGADGFFLPDSVGWKRGVDSLFALGVTVVCGVCCDSIQQYASEINYLAQFPNAYFAVERWAGTTLSFREARAALEAQVGAGRVSSLLMGGMHDINGLVEAGVLVPQRADSIAWAIRHAGFTCVSFNAEADSAASMADSTAWTSQQRALFCAGGGYVMALAYPGFNHRGATIANGRDSTEETYGSAHKMPNDSTFVSHYYQRSIYGLLYDYWFPPIDYSKVRNTSGRFQTTATQRPWYGEPALSGAISPKATVRTGTNLLCISSSNLGTGQYGTASPNMPGFYYLKYVRNALYALNYSDGRTLARFVLPEELGAQDIRR